MITNVLKTLGSLRSALVAGVVGLPFLMAVSAYAQEPTAAGGEQTTERVVVTGSYIPTAEEVTASPLDTVTSQDINRSGNSEVLQILQKRNPDFTGGLNIGTTNANVSAGATNGGSSIQIRAYPTLVLYEGRRIADASTVASGDSVFTDVSLFPASLIGRIEVLKDGASALYGSEAVGGVVNIFTKDDFQGAEFGFRYGTTVEGAVAERRGYGIAGIGNETTQVTFGMQYLEMDPLYARQRDYSRISLGGGSSNYSGSVRDASSRNGNGGRYLPAGLDPVNYPGPIRANSPFDVGVLPGSVPPGPAGGFGAPQFNGYYVPVTTQANFNLNSIPTSTLENTRTNAVASFNHQVFGKQLEFFGNFLYGNTTNRNFLNAQPITLGQGLVILGSVKFDPNAGPDLDGDGFPDGAIVAEDRGAPAAFNPFQQTLDANSQGGPPGTPAARARLINAMRYQVRPRIFDYDNQFYRFLGGLRSQINENWMYEGAAYYSKYTVDYRNSNLPILSQINNAIAGTGDFAGSPLDPFAINPLGSGPGQLSPALFSSMFGTNIRSQSSYQRVFDSKIVGFPFSLPAGKLGLSIGTEYRVEGFAAIDSPEIFLGSTPISDINVKRNITSFYGEVSVPIVSSAMNIPFVYNLEMNGAFRHDHYKGVNPDANVPKVTLRYQPIKDLTMRATYSASFIAPTLFETNGPSLEAFTGGIDLGQGSEQAQVLSGSNTNLSPSTAETYTAGLVYSPHFVPGLTVSIDAFRTLQVNIIGSIPTSTILFDVEANGPASAFAPLVAFTNFPGRPGARPVTGPGQLAGSLNTVFVVATNQNLGGSRTEGFDLSLRYNIELGVAGQLELGVAALYLTNYDVKNLPIHDEYYNLIGLVGGEGFGAIPDYRINFLLEHRWRGFTLSLNANYIPEMLNAAPEDPAGDQSTFQPVDDFLTVDGRLSYTFKGRTTTSAAVETKDAKSIDAKATAAAGTETMSPVQRLLDGLTLTVGCNNMFNEDPPLLLSANSNSDLSAYDPFGQFVYFEISKKF